MGPFLDPLDLLQQAAPVTPPAAGTRRLFTNAATGEVSVQTSAGATVSLETGGAGAAEPETELAYLGL